MGINTWLQSTFFHAREMPVTEALDYHGASMGLCVSLATVMIAHMPGTWSMFWCVVTTFVPIFVFWMYHVLWLSVVKFDYGHNMKVVVSLGVCGSILWMVWFLRFRKEKPFAWKIVLATWGPYMLLPFELLDFPPILGLLDAHACWHLGTIPLNFVFCSFIRDNILHEEEKMLKMTKNKKE